MDYWSKCCPDAEIPADAWTAQPTKLRALVFPTLQPSHDAQLNRIRPFEALVQLREAGIWLGYPLTEERVSRFLSCLESTPAYTLTYGSLDEATEQMATLSHVLRNPAAQV